MEDGGSLWVWKVRCPGKSEKACCSASCGKTPGRRAEINLKEKDLFCLVISEVPVHVEWFCCFCTMIKHNIMVSCRVAYLMAKNQRSEMMKRMGQGQDMVPKDSPQGCTLFKLPTSPNCPSKCEFINRPIQWWRQNPRDQSRPQS